MEETAQVLAAAVVEPASLISAGVLLTAALVRSEGLVAAVTHAIDCELPAALALPRETAQELAQAALSALAAHLYVETAAAHPTVEAGAAQGAGPRLAASAPR